MADKEIVCGIVLYNPDIEGLRKNIDAVINQVDKVYVFDNASVDNKGIKALLSDYGDKITYEASEENKGLGYGLNKVLEYAVNNDFEWFLTVDQDSLPDPELISKYRPYMSDSDIAVICPVPLVNKKTTLEEFLADSKAGMEIENKAVEVITAGCLCRSKYSMEIGGFREDFFIDCLDFEYNCRVLENGKKIARVTNAYIIQTLGEGVEIKLFSFLHRTTKLGLWRMLKVVPVYPDLRLFYMARNSRATKRMHKNSGFKLSRFYTDIVFAYFMLCYPYSRNRIKMLNSIRKGYKESKNLNG